MKVAALLSLSALALAAPTPEANAAEAVKVPLARRRQQGMTHTDGQAHLPKIMRDLKHTLLKYNKDFELPDFLVHPESVLGKRDTNANEPLTDQNQNGEDEEYYGVGYVGAARQAFTFDFDTGSADLFVPGPNCGQAQGCVGNTHYNQQGQSEGTTTSITYGSGAVSGANYLDSVTVAGLTVPHQNVVSLASSAGFSTGGNDALMGMGFQSIANSHSTPFFFNLVNQGSVSPTEFSFYLGRAQSGTAGKSEMTLGGRDTSKFTGATTSIPVTSQGYWQVAIDGATVNGGSIVPQTANGQAAIDTGTTLLLGPNAAVSAIYNKIPGSFPLWFAGGATTQLYAYPCAANPQISLVFGGKSFAVNPLDFNFGTVGTAVGGLYGLFFPNYCVGAVAGADLNPSIPNFWIVGDTFLKNWYSTFSYSSPSSASVSFAKAV